MDNILPVMALVVTVLLGVPGLYLAWKQLRRKELSYEVLPSIPVVQVGDAGKQTIGEDWDAIEVRYRGQPVNDVQLVRVRIWNSGNVEIRPEDFYSSLRVKFSGNMLQVGVLEASPPKLREAILTGGGYGGGSGVGPDGASGEITFNSKFLLNQGHSITMKLLLGDFKGTDTVSVDADIAGVPAIRRVSRGQLTRTRRLQFAIYCIIAGLAGYSISTAAGRLSSLNIIIVIVSMLLILVAGALLGRFLSMLRADEKPVKGF